MDHISMAALFLKVPITHIFFLKFSAKEFEALCLFIERTYKYNTWLAKTIFHSELYLQPKPL